MFKKLLFFLLYLTLFNSFLYSQPVKTEYLDAELISQSETIQPGKTFSAAVKLNIKNGWHIYWRNPGDGGLATKVKWNLPAGFRASSILWPYPAIFEGDGGLVSYGYSDEVLLLFEITPPDALKETEQIELKAKVSWLACKEVCIPGSADIFLTLPVKNSTSKENKKWSKFFTGAKEKLPAEKHDWKITASLNGSSIIIKGIKPSSVKETPDEIIFFPYDTGIFAASKEQKLSLTGNGFELEVKLETLKSSDPKNIKGILFSESGWSGKSSRKTIEINISL